jgi:uroporphyrinogen-III decarboxylase
MCHCCGDQTDVLPWFEKWGIDAVHPLQPKYNDIYEVREKYPDLTLIGNIDIDILTRGTEAEIRDNVQKHLERLAPSGRYVACSSHSIIDSVPPGNFEIMLSVVQSYTC